jgi:HEAT repeat protein/outer membrane protein assembly factor BamB
MARRFVPLLALAAVPVSCAHDATPSTERPSQSATHEPLSPSLTRQWEHRLTAADPSTRAIAAGELTQGAERSLPLLKRLLSSHNPDVRQAAFDIAYRIGPPAIGVLADMLEDRRLTSRHQAIDLLIDLAPDTESIQPLLCRALKDPDPIVGRDAARAIGALDEKAAPSVPSLIEALAHPDAHVRLYTAEALASIGPPASPATTALASLLHDPVPGVRWAACEGLASIGPAASPAVPQLAEALKDEALYVRICAAGALGSIGPGAQAAVDSLREAAKDPALQSETAWALDRISGSHGKSTFSTATPEIAVRQINASPPAPASAVNPPIDWDTTTGRNIVWSVELGAETFGRPVLSGGVVYIGTNNARKLNPAFADPCGVLLALRAADGAFLWQDLAPRVKRGLREFLLPSTTSAPYIDGDRLYYLTAECQLRCLNLRAMPDCSLPRYSGGGLGWGFLTGAKIAPTLTLPRTTGGGDQDQHSMENLWELDLCSTLGVFPHEACNSEILSLGDLLILCTSNGQNEGHTRVPSPRAPSLIAVDKHSGKVVWQAIGAGENILHGQWCSPIAANVNGRTQVLFGGGDGWLRAYDPASGRELWRFDGNPKDAPWRPRPGVFSRCSIIAWPVYDGAGRIFLAMGEDPSHGNGPSLLHAISPSGQGDVTESRRLWICRQIGRVVATPVVADGLLYVADLGGTVYCVDTTSGQVLWKHDTSAAIWGCLSLAGPYVYAGNVDGTMTILRAGRQKNVVTEIQMDDPLYSRPAFCGDAMYLATARRLYLIHSRRR